MRISKTPLVYYGVKLPLNEYFYNDWTDRYSNLMDFAPDFLELTPEEQAAWDGWPDVLFDDKTDEYMILGLELFDFGGRFLKYDPSVTHSIDDVMNQAKTYKEGFVKWFPEFRHLVEVPFNFLTVMHFH